MTIPTCDPHVVIESQEPGRVVYLIPATGERWRIDGTCNQCGKCWEGATYSKPELDCPVRPEIKDVIPDCTLSGEYL